MRPFLLACLALAACGRNGQPAYVAQDWYDVEYLEGDSISVVFQPVGAPAPLNLILHRTQQLIPPGSPFKIDWTIYTAKPQGQQRSDADVRNLRDDPFILWFKDGKMYAGHIPRELNGESGTIFLTAVRSGEKKEPIAVYGRDSNGKAVNPEYAEPVFRGLSPVRSLRGGVAKVLNRETL